MTRYPIIIAFACGCFHDTPAYFTNSESDESSTSSAESGNSENSGSPTPSTATDSGSGSNTQAWTETGPTDGSTDIGSNSSSASMSDTGMSSSFSSSSSSGTLTDAGTSTDNTPSSTTSSDALTTSAPQTSTDTTTTSDSTTSNPTTSGAGSWYAPCYSNIDCEAPLYCYMSVIGKGHCTGYCDCLVPGDCGQSTCPAPGDGNVAAWCYGDFCWLFRAAVSCAALDCPDWLTCYEVYDGGEKAICAAP